MKHSAIFLSFWPPMTLKIDYWVVRGEVTVTKIITVVLLCLDLQVFSGPLRSLFLLSCHLSLLAFKNSHIMDRPMRDRPTCPPHTYLRKHEDFGMEWGCQCVRASFCSIYFMCISQEKDVPFQEPGTTQDSEAAWDRWPHQVGLFGQKLSYFSRDWLGNSVTLHNRSWDFKL